MNQTIKMIIVMLTLSIFNSSHILAETPTSVLVGFTEKEEAKIVAIEKALDQKCDLILKETSLAQLSEMLTKKMSVEVQLDKVALEEESINISTTKFTKTLKNMSYRSALKFLFAGSSLDFISHQEVLLITSKERAASPELLHTRFYPVEDLVTKTKLDKNKKKEIEIDFDSINRLNSDHHRTEFLARRRRRRWNYFLALRQAKLKILAISQSPEIHRKIEVLITKLRKLHQQKQKEKPARPTKKKERPFVSGGGIPRVG